MDLSGRMAAFHPRPPCAELSGALQAWLFRLLCLQHLLHHTLERAFIHMRVRAMIKPLISGGANLAQQGLSLIPFKQSFEYISHAAHQMASGGGSRPEGAGLAPQGDALPVHRLL